MVSSSTRRSSINLPATFLKTLRDIHDDADAWLVRLPHLIATCETRWNLRVVGQAGRLSYALVLFAERATGTQRDGSQETGTPVVLKLSPPSPEVSREAEALRRYGGDGICRLLDHDPEGEVLLLEKLTPGTSLWDLWTPARDDAHTRLTAQLMMRLWRGVPPAHPFRTLASWAEALFEQTPEGPLPSAQVRRAQGLFDELHVTDAPVLLHADLHHGNILSAHREPHLAIDPKGVVGARGYEVGPYLLNPDLDRHADLHALSARRVAIFSEMLGMDETEVAAWGFVHMLLSACWSLEDHGGGHETALRVAASLERLL